MYVLGSRRESLGKSVSSSTTWSEGRIQVLRPTSKSYAWRVYLCVSYRIFVFFSKQFFFKSTETESFENRELYYLPQLNSRKIIFVNCNTNANVYICMYIMWQKNCFAKTLKLIFGKMRNLLSPKFFPSNQLFR